jgi:aspartyl-tRNA(Asn)/glutamyl-tRNA(Gln) amidotransferase subunit B
MPVYESVIGLETHIQLSTTTKIFCGCKADSWEAAPNTNVCPVCTGLPGVLPVLNQAVIEKGILLAAAMHSSIRPLSFFDRKNYFYPDLPKGYQISQYDMALGDGGYFDLPTPDSPRRVSITKMHLEEDAGKTKKVGSRRLIDFNRCGVPLIEMVTGPDLRTADEAAEYLFRLRQLLRWLGISEADMEKGHLRCDANVSIRIKGEGILNPKTEIKNVNSIESVRESINKEFERQIREVEAGNVIQTWTLEWDEDKGMLSKMRSKETEADYRYFREPDLLPVKVDDTLIQSVLKELPELPLACRQRFMDDLDLPLYDADILTADRSLAEYFEESVKTYGGEAKKVSNWLMNDVMRMMNEEGLAAHQLKLSPHHLAEILKLVDAGTINNSTGKKLLKKVQAGEGTPAEIVKAEGLAQVSDEGAIRSVCAEVIAEHPDEAAAYKSGKESLVGWFVGQVMRKMRGKADAKLAQAILAELLTTSE